MATKKVPPSSENQDAQKWFVEQAQKVPGVAEAIAVYGRLAPYATLGQSQTATKIGYAVGGNK